MKPFDLEAAKRGEPIVTRDGKQVRFVAYAPECEIGYRVVARIETAPRPGFFFENGRVYDGNDHAHDLFMAPRKRTVYVNVYARRLDNNVSPGNVAAAFDAEEGARLNARLDAAGLLAVAVPAEIEE